MAVLPGVWGGGGDLSRWLVLFGSVTLAVVLASCDSRTREELISEAALRDTLGLGPRVVLHRVALGGDRNGERIFPEESSVEEGDVVAFETIDGHVHELAFEPDSLSLEVLEFLQRTGQMKAPPLIHLGTRFLIDLEDAPDGRYLFRARTVGEPAFGVIWVGLEPN